MSSDLPDELLGPSGGDSSERRRGEGGDDDREEAVLVQFVFVSVGDRRLAVAVEDVKTVVDHPSELTRVPRSPPTVCGVTDLRGEITAVIEPREHFAVDGDPSTRQKLLVFDRPNDEQSAAIRIDEVIGVEAVPEDNVVDATDLEPEEATDDALAHPLLRGVVRQERRPEMDVREVVSGRATGAEADRDEANDASPMDRFDSTLSRRARRRESIRTTDRFDGETFDLEADETGDDTEDDAGTDDEDDIVVETTALLDVDGLLAASGRPA